MRESFPRGASLTQNPAFSSSEGPITVVVRPGWPPRVRGAGRTPQFGYRECVRSAELAPPVLGCQKWGWATILGPGTLNRPRICDQFAPPHYPDAMDSAGWGLSGVGYDSGAGNGCGFGRMWAEHHEHGRARAGAGVLRVPLCGKATPIWGGVRGTRMVARRCAGVG